MQTMLSFDVPRLARQVTYTDNILLIGSCFTEHISGRLEDHKFKVLANPHGILFNPLSVAQSINSYLDNKVYGKEELFQLNELWNSWDHHTRFSHVDADAALQLINRSQHEAAAFMQKADQVIITLGSAFQYYLNDTGRPVANNHRAPAQWFSKKLLSIDEIVAIMGSMLDRLFKVNPFVRVIFTISPVRHIRDGVVDNNRSKARLIEAVHTLTAQFERAVYFPAYELVIDVLRDHRYYDIDLVHPNYQATTYVWEQFVKACIDPAAHDLMQQVQEIATARAHRCRFPQTDAHKKFKTSYAHKAKALMDKYPFLDLGSEVDYFSE